MIQIDVRAQIKEAQQFLKRVEKQAYRKATARALNDTVRTLRAEGAREIKKSHPALRIGDIKRAMVESKAHQYKLTASVKTTGRPLSLKLFNLKQLKRGTITAKIGRRQRPVMHRGRKGFIVAKYGNEAFVRRFPTGRQIRRFRGPSLPGVFRAQTSKFKRIAGERFPKAFYSRMQYEIERAKR